MADDTCLTVRCSCQGAAPAPLPHRRWQPGAHRSSEPVDRTWVGAPERARAGLEARVVRGASTRRRVVRRVQQTSTGAVSPLIAMAVKPACSWARTAFGTTGTKHSTCPGSTGASPADVPGAPSCRRPASEILYTTSAADGGDEHDAGAATASRTQAGLSRAEGTFRPIGMRRASSSVRVPITRVGGAAAQGSRLLGERALPLAPETVAPPPLVRPLHPRTVQAAAAPARREPNRLAAATGHEWSRSARIGEVCLERRDRRELPTRQHVALGGPPDSVLPFVRARNGLHALA